MNHLIDLIFLNNNVAFIAANNRKRLYFYQTTKQSKDFKDIKHIGKELVSPLPQSINKTMRYFFMSILLKLNFRCEVKTELFYFAITNNKQRFIVVSTLLLLLSI